ncbi:EAL domain-containing protein [Ideonella paludis]|uniref:EAL domain-containing protein n=1 Tax=Ideonella paludis TaxID=1233411 RepID=UPI00362CF730
MRQHRWLACEVLLRLHHPQWGHLAPAEVVPRLERAGDMAEVGPWILDQACQALQRLQAQGQPALCMALNLTRSQLQSNTWPAQAMRLLARYGLAPVQVEWEISEAMAVDEDADVRRGLSRLRELGFGLSVDDYGTGYCNVARLIEVAPQRVKIDRSLIQAAQEAAGDERALKSLIESSHAMDMQVTAVGVETPALLQRLQKLGCDAVQGYGVAPPLSPSGLMHWQPALHPIGQ